MSLDTDIAAAPIGLRDGTGTEIGPREVSPCLLCPSMSAVGNLLCKPQMCPGAVSALGKDNGVMTKGQVSESWFSYHNQLALALSTWRNAAFGQLPP